MFRNASLAAALVLLFPAASVRTAETVVRRTDPRRLRVDVAYSVALERGGPDRILIALPLPVGDGYQDAAPPPDLPGSVRTFPETGDPYLEVVLKGADIGTRRRFSVEYGFAVTLYDVSSDLSRVAEIYPYWEDSPLYRRHTARAGEYVLPGHPEISALAEDLWKNSADRLDFARRAFDHVVANFALRPAGIALKPLSEALEGKAGGEGDIVSVWVSLLRNRGMPARHAAGVDASGRRRVFGEFFLQYYGWIPADPAAAIRRPEGDFFGAMRGADAVAVLSRDVNLTVDTGDWRVIEPYPRENTVDTMLRGRIWQYYGLPRHFSDGQSRPHARVGRAGVRMDSTAFSVGEIR